ncbi:hypothetical protein [Curtobacterium sp. DN_7.5]|uniref:hypothetical protein n=1 Tax=Curtobacterium sp. DN_7.5 TaxID=3049047 RepID=UPI001F571EDE|nr:hypothetical protein [Curtobacterium sp. DN_7.5]
MSAFVRDNQPAGAEEPDAFGIDLVDGDEPAVRILVRGELPATVEHDGRTWVATDETHDAGDDGPPIAVFRPRA